MITKNGRYICDICGKFVPYREYYSWTERGFSYSQEPPDPCFAHTKCYENLDENRKNTIIKISWVKPYYHIYNET